MPEPSIKGTIFAKLVEDVKKLVDGDEAARSALAERLSADELGLLDSEISPAAWYSIETYTRISQTLLDFEGDGNLNYLEKRGAESAQRLIEAGVYAQFEYLSRTEASRESDPAARYVAFGRDLRILSTLSSSILNFSKWTHLPDPDHENRWMFEVTEAGDYPDLLGHTTTGLLNGMSVETRGAKFWSWERVSRDVIRFRMSSDI